ncbi:MAG: HTH domain-containing protein [Terracoccus sp.]
MRAGRLLSLLLILQKGGRLTARELATRLEVSERTVLRDLEVLSGAGVPVYAVRGRGGGFELLDTFEMTVPPVTPGLTRTRGQTCRVRVRISPAALQVAVMLGRPAGWRHRPSAAPQRERPDWVEGSFRFDSYESATRELLGLGIDVEVVLPLALRERMVEIGRRISELHRS